MPLHQRCADVWYWLNDPSSRRIERSHSRPAMMSSASRQLAPSAPGKRAASAESTPRRASATSAGSTPAATSPAPGVCAGEATRPSASSACILFHSIW